MGETEIATIRYICVFTFLTINVLTKLIIYCKGNNCFAYDGFLTGLQILIMQVIFYSLTGFYSKYDSFIIAVGVLALSSSLFFFDD